MRVPHYAKRSLAALALTMAVVTAGCGGGDSNAPNAPFDPEGTSSDIGAIEASFESPATSGFAAAASAISVVLGESPAAAAVRVMPTKDLTAGGKPTADHYSATVAKAYLKPAGGIRPSLSTAAIPEQYLGVTFTYDAATGYGPSDLTGAPENGVRFIVYAVDPISGVPIQPLIEVGYADIITTETASAATVQIELVSAGVTYLDYTVGATSSASGVTVSISGFVTNGDDRVNFDLDNQLDSESLALDYTLTVPTRGGFRIDFEGEMIIATATTTTTLEARGPHGTVSISGTQSSTEGSYQVEVNGELFASITTAPTAPTVIVGADGQALTGAELDALGAIFAVFLGGFDFFEDLIDPVY
jgi:hypothetical protein